VTDIAETVLEHAIVAVQQGRLEFQSVAWVLAATDLFLPSATEPTDAAMESIAPLVVESDGQQFLAVFTASGRAAAFAPAYGYLSVRTGFEVMRFMPPGVGLVVNPGSEIGFEMRADGVERLRGEIQPS
jgi:hypothetical protein